MDPDVAANLNGSIPESNSKPTTVYFGVHIPNDANNGENNVFEDKDSALKVAKKHKKSRFKPFQFYHEAVDFSLYGSEFPNNNSMIDGIDGEKKELTPLGEKASPFRTPRPQELTEFRSKIENNNLNSVIEMIELNPKYLVSSGDTPSILQEGARLNALHVVAKVKNSEIAEYILSTISNPEFVKRLYGDDNQDNANQRCKMLLDLYLNTPNKGFNDTPLHIASKWGADTIVEVLLSYPECDKSKRNKHNKLAEDVICERADPKTPAFVKKKIQQLLCDNYYVPVLRTEDNTLPPVVGVPFSPTSPPVLNKDPLSPRLEIHAYAGPMDKKEAETFRKVWKTPPRSLNFNSPNAKSSPVENLTALRLKDPEKGLERLGKKLASNYQVSWHEYWEFLDCFVDISSEEGLNLLESHLRTKEKDLQDKFQEWSPMSPLSHPPTEAVSPMSSLCNAFSACKLDDTNSPSFLTEWKSPIDQQQVCRPLVYVDKACQVFANRLVTNVYRILRCSEREYESTVKVLQTDIKLLELLINSYMEDDRFTEWVNFQKVHSRLAHLIAKKLRESYKDCDESFLVNKFETLLESIVKKSDYFSSDDEGVDFKKAPNKPTVYRKQVVCLLSRIKSTLESHSVVSDIDDDHLTINGWHLFNVCNCVFHPKKPKKNNLSRNNSFKNHLRKPRRFDLQNVSKKLFVGDDLLTNNQFIGANGDLGFNLSSDSSKSDTDDDFYTPPSSPSKIQSESASDSEDQFSDAEPPKFDLFLEGAFPTKTDYAVFNALKYADCDIDLKKYPMVFNWHHSILLYKESERQAWPSPHGKQRTPEPASPVKSCGTPRPSWLRITGTNSPRAAIKSFSPSRNY
ncbi:ankyrin repeat and LEM domain-containing protein 2 homolog isoform X2 [Anthonomus grandis grandis]|nr:ankyrin repeat and LEM domain-containing protein 2 homolog isoform X2 [Anthonomus grandis grandis]XP_050308113.1 ankyrin repeat and LEM domain-containing protein 2 homolog isoform X2 [Anthonomus grandis grandis]XP_050308114.1 ankyrin repeat and LEM domain-containing protein 2 homolog isoform X2 [Anthonomus grandis grandis]